MEQETEAKKKKLSSTKTRIFFKAKQGEITAMCCKVYLLLVLLFVVSGTFEAIRSIHDHTRNLDSNFSSLAGIELPVHVSFNVVASSTSTGCNFTSSEKSKKVESTNLSEEDNVDDEIDGEDAISEESNKQTVKLHLKHRPIRKESEAKGSVAESNLRDLTRIQTLHTRITEEKNQNTISRLKKDIKQPKKDIKRVVAPAASPKNQNTVSRLKKDIKRVVSPAASPESSGFSGQLMATLESGVSLGSGEYFMDVFVGTPPKHLSLILDTGSDLNWIQCVPCYDCFEQNGPYYDPKDSNSFKNIGCNDPRCHLVSSPDPPQPCKADNQTCPYFYWYGDSSNTTGEFALETFTVNLTSSTGKSKFTRVKNVMFGCGHWNRGLFHGAAGLLGLGRGPLSFSSQLQSLYGHSFSYCLVDRNSDANVTSKLIFGEDKDLLNHPELNFTSLVAGKENPADTFYYVHIKSVMVGGEALKIPEESWQLSVDGSGGTIIDSGTTLSYFAKPAYEIIKEAFLKRVKGYPLLKDIPILEPCYNVSGVEKMEVPDFGLLFADGAVWNFPVENYFIRLDEDVVCLAIMATPQSPLSIIGNYQQQNFHILYDTKKSRLGYAPANCADI
ncbi:hypothetical protein HS088_TW18G00016 [Tripterygium wilfordii]|uniref:Peptidase A1 domain-containing protein n=1 Tax=Tripterygium wilfordii TaxID=458696 RepID=A0A7J7CB48_TRIWF|nr:hypothetical protein HS088_TW18G00016 [Tripterygium wilfordii]